MEKDVRDFKCYPTKHHKEKVSLILVQLLDSIEDYSILSRNHAGFSFTEYAFLYKDLWHFYNTDMLTRNNYQVRKILSFRNSFELLYNKTSKIATCEHIIIHCVFRDSYKFFQEWLNEIEQIAINTLASN